METTFKTAAAEAQAAFGNNTLYMERYVGDARHIEVQILGDHFGKVVHLGERDCSLQRRHQKVIEESPSLAVDEPLRRKIAAAAAAVAGRIPMAVVASFAPCTPMLAPASATSVMRSR